VDLTDFIKQVPGFDGLLPRDKICLMFWHLHTHENAQVVGNAHIRNCFKQLHAVAPDVSVYLPRMLATEHLVRSGNGYKLEGSLRRSFDEKYGQQPSVVAITNLLAELPTQIPNAEERVFLTEALNCYRVKAYRSSIVMTWNLAFDHLLRWIIGDAKRLAEFNAAIGVRFQKRAGEVVRKVEDFEEFKEADIIEICRTADLLTKNITEILREKLKRRNIAAHPSQVIVTQSQADDAISDLINNVVLALA
jgi:hypothetical protein